MTFIRQSTSVTIMFGPMLDITDGVTEETTLTLAQADMRISKDGGTFAQKSAAGNATHNSDGWYFTTLSTADTNTIGELVFNVHQPANALPIWLRFQVIEENVFDTLFGFASTGPLQGTTVGNTLDVNATGEAGLDLDNTSGTISAAQIAADAITAAKVADGTIDAATFAAGAINAAAIAADAITAAKVAADVHAEAADAVWDEPKADHLTVTTFGDLATDLDSVLGDTGDMQPKLGAPAADIAADIAAVQADTDNIQTRLPAALVGGAMDSDVSAIQAGAIDAAAIATDAIDADALAADAVTEIIGQVSGTADSGSTTTLVDVARTEADTDYWKGSVLLITSGTIAGQVRRITAFNPGTDEITVDTAFTQAVGTNTYTILKTTYVEAPAAGSGDWSTAEREQIRDALGVDGTKTAATGGDLQEVLTDTGTTIPGTITTLQADTDDIQTRLPAALVGGAIDADVSAVQANAIDAAALAADVTTELRSLVGGTASSGSTTTLVDAGRTEADTDYWKGCWLLITSGTAVNQVRLITDFTPGTDTITFAPATTQAISTNTYEILPASAVDLRLWNGTAPNNLVGGAVDSDVSAMQAGTVTAAAIATDAIDDDAIATGAIANTAFAAGAIDAAAIAANAIGASELATDAIGADQLAATAVDEIKDAILPVINTAYSDIPIFMADSTDHITAKTGLTLGVTRSIDGGAFGAGTGTAAEISNGMYQYDASAADMNGSFIVFRFTGTGADDTFVVVRTGG